MFRRLFVRVVSVVILTALFLGTLITLRPAQKAEAATSAITLTNITRAQQLSGPSIQWTHTSSGTNTILIIGLSYRSPGKLDTILANSVLVNNLPAKKIRRDRGHEYVTELWYFVNPAAGSIPVKVTFAGAVNSVAASAMTFSGVEPTDPIRTDSLGRVLGVGKVSSVFVKTHTLAVPSANEELVVGVASSYSGTNNVVNVPTDVTQRYNDLSTNVIGVGVTKASITTSTSLTWNSTTAWPWAASAISLKPARLSVPTMSVKVFGVGYNPTENGQNIASTYYQANMGNLTPEQMEDQIFAKTKNAFSELSGGQIQYSIVGKTRVTTFQPYTDNFTYTLSSFSRCVLGNPNYNAAACEAQKIKFNYEKWIKDNRICEQAAAVGADEIWVVAPPYLMAWESYIVGPTASFNINGPYKIVTNCTKHMAVMHGTYERNESMLHIFGHRFEATMTYLTATWKAVDKTNYWERFAATNLYKNIQPTTIYCGNAHFPSNSFTVYDYANSTSKTNNCGDFSSFPFYNGMTATGSCNLWGCTEEGWQKYWLSKVPRSTGVVKMVSTAGKAFTFSRNWWEYWLSPTAAKAQRAKM